MLRVYYFIYIFFKIKKEKRNKKKIFKKKKITCKQRQPPTPSISLRRQHPTYSPELFPMRHSASTVQTATCTPADHPDFSLSSSSLKKLFEMQYKRTKIPPLCSTIPKKQNPKSNHLRTLALAVMSLKSSPWPNPPLSSPSFSPSSSPPPLTAADRTTTPTRTPTPLPRPI